MKKRTMLILFGIAIILIFALYFLLPIIRWRLGEPPYFAEYDGPEQVHEAIILELPPNEVSWSDVANAIETERFGSMYCSISQTYPTYPRNPNADEKALVCRASTGRFQLFPGEYQIIFFFDGDTLIDVQTKLEYR